jgi:hypothetical protein
MSEAMSRMVVPPLVAFALTLLLSMAAGAGETFLVELEDLPLAPGLTELPGGLLFDSAGGRIVETAASGTVSAEQVRQFYGQTLPQLGWQNSGDLQFRRDNEILTILIDERRKPLTVRFTLSPTH